MASIIENYLKGLLENVSLKSIFTGFIAAIVALFTMISTGNTGKLAMRVVGEVNTNSKEIVVEISNYTFNTVKDEAGYSGYKLEQKVGGEWKEIPILGANKDIAYGDIKPLTSSTRIINLGSPIFGITLLTEGDYRLTKTFPNGEVASAEFNVASASAQKAA